MGERVVRITRTSGMSSRRAGCGESRTSDPYAEHPTREGKVYRAVVLDAFGQRVVGWSNDASPMAALVTNALGMAIGQRGFVLDLQTLRS